VYLERNPIANDNQYRNKILDVLPRLKQIDAIQVPPNINRPR
jgi:hypothetical protein